jgi:membrane dipeptidase
MYQRLEGRATCMLPRLPVVDLHVDTPHEYLKQGPFTLAAGAPDGQVDIGRLQSGGYIAQVLVVWVPPEEADHPNHAERAFGAVQSLIDGSGGALRRARSPGEVEAIAAEGGIAALVAMEGAHPLGGQVEALDRWVERGIVYLGLTWNNSNPFADAALDPQPPNGGLSPLGRSLIARCAAAGVAVDLSHSSAATFWHVYEHASQPFIASHSDALSFKQHGRNLDDEQLAALGRAGGLVGLNYHARFLSPKKFSEVRVTDAADVLQHLVRVAGIDHVGLGSDFDGTIVPPTDMPDAGAVPVLFEELARRGFSDEALVKIAGGNVLRVLGDIQGRRGRPDHLDGAEPMRLPLAARDAAAQGAVEGPLGDPRHALDRNWLTATRLRLDRSPRIELTVDRAPDAVGVMGEGGAAGQPDGQVALEGVEIEIERDGLVLVRQTARVTPGVDGPSVTSIRYVEPPGEGPVRVRVTPVCARSDGEAGIAGIVAYQWPRRRAAGADAGGG